jgi:hypothetical protein
VIISNEENDEPPMKKAKPFMASLMDKNSTRKQSPVDELDRYIDMQIQDGEQYLDPLLFWKKKENRIAFPHLARLAARCFCIPCSSAAVERQFSCTGQIITQRRANLDPVTVNNIIFLRSMQNKFER